MPDFYNGVREMNTLLTAEQFVIDALQDGMDRANNNVFVMLADSDGLKVWEKSLGLVSIGDLETRRMKVLMRILPPKPLTLRYLRETIALLKINATISIDYAARKVDVTAGTTDSDAMNRLNYILHTWLPANMNFTSFNLVKTSTSGTAYVGTASSLGTAIQGKSEDQ
jgi:hypothetical protein